MTHASSTIQLNSNRARHSTFLNGLRLAVSWGTGATKGMDKPCLWTRRAVLWLRVWNSRYNLLSYPLSLKHPIRGHRHTWGLTIYFERKVQTGNTRLQTCRPQDSFHLQGKLLRRTPLGHSRLWPVSSLSFLHSLTRTSSLLLGWLLILTLQCSKLCHKSWLLLWNWTRTKVMPTDRARILNNLPHHTLAMEMVWCWKRFLCTSE